MGLANISSNGGMRVGISHSQQLKVILGLISEVASALSVANFGRVLRNEKAAKIILYGCNVGGSNPPSSTPVIINIMLNERAAGTDKTYRAT